MVEFGEQRDGSTDSRIAFINRVNLVLPLDRGYLHATVRRNDGRPVRRPSEPEIAQWLDRRPCPKHRSIADRDEPCSPPCARLRAGRGRSG